MLLVAAFEVGDEAESLCACAVLRSARCPAVEVVDGIEGRWRVDVRRLPRAGEADVPGLSVETGVGPEQGAFYGEPLGLVWIVSA